MAEEFLKILNQIIERYPSEWTEADKEFIKARREYLTEEQKEKVANVLKEKPLREIVEEEEEPIEIKKKGRPKKIK